MAKIVKDYGNGYVATGNKDKPNRWTIISKRLLNIVTLGKVYPLIAPDDTFKSVKHEGIVLSPDNSKVKRHGKRRNTLAVAYGKMTIASCPFAGSCIRFCYQNLNSYTASLRMHAHNYNLIYSAKYTEIVKLLDVAIAALSRKVTIIRLNDNGDFISKAEILAWVTMAEKYSHIVFYGYTKNTPHLYKARQEYGKAFPTNFRISISDLNENDTTSEVYQNIIRETYEGEFRVCRIIDTPERDTLYADLPWNDEEMKAYDYTSDFKIALHVGASQFEFCTPDEMLIVNKYASGTDENGIHYC